MLCMLSKSCFAMYKYMTYCIRFRISLYTISVFSTYKNNQTEQCILLFVAQIQPKKITDFKAPNRPPPSRKTSKSTLVFQIKSSGPNILFTAKTHQTPDNNFNLMAILKKAFGDMRRVPGCILLFLIITGQTSVL